jgi:hypothetical protein
VTSTRFRAARFWLTGQWREEGAARLASREPGDFGSLADLCDSALAPSREIDMLVALAVSPRLRLLASPAPGVWAVPDGSRVRAPRYTSSTAAALTLVPDGYWIEYNPRAAGRIEIRGPGGECELGWGRNTHFPLAACAAALRALARLADGVGADGVDGQPRSMSAGVVTALEESR